MVKAKKKSNNNIYLIFGFAIIALVVVLIAKKSMTAKPEINMVIDDSQNTTAAPRFTPSSTWLFSKVGIFDADSGWKAYTTYSPRPVWKEGKVVWNSLKPNNRFVMHHQNINITKPASNLLQNVMLVKYDPKIQEAIDLSKDDPNSKGTVYRAVAGARKTKLELAFYRTVKVTENNRDSADYGKKVQKNLLVWKGSVMVEPNKGIQDIYIPLPKELSYPDQTITLNFDQMTSKEAAVIQAKKGIVMNADIYGIYLGKLAVKPNTEKQVAKPALEGTQGFDENQQAAE